MTELTNTKPDSQSEELRKIYGDRTYYVESDMSGNILKLETDDQDVIGWAKSKGLVEKA